MAKQSSKIVYRTKDYAKFAKDECNRDTRPNPDLEASMQRYGWLDAYPAMVEQVGQMLVIKDGQHRFETAKKLGIDVAYVICDIEDLDVAFINKPQRQWTVADYVGSYAKQGIEDYVKLKQFAEVNKLPIGLSASILQNITNAENVRSGKFKIRDYGLACDVILIVQVCRGLGIKFADNSHFVNAVTNVFRYTQARASTLAEKIQAHSALLTHQPTVEKFVETISLVYNRNTPVLSKLDIPAKVRQVLLFIRSQSRKGGKKCN